MIPAVHTGTSALISYFTIQIQRNIYYVLVPNLSLSTLSSFVLVPLFLFDFFSVVEIESVMFCGSLLYWCTNFSLAPTPSTHPVGQTTCDLQFLTFFFSKWISFGAVLVKKDANPTPYPPVFRFDSQGYHDRGTKGILGTKVVLEVFLKLWSRTYIKRKACVFTMILQHWKKKTWFDLVPNMINAFLLKNV